MLCLRTRQLLPRARWAQVHSWVAARERALLDDLNVTHAERASTFDRQRVALTAFGGAASSLGARIRSELARAGATLPAVGDGNARTGGGGGGGGGSVGGGGAGSLVSTAALAALLAAREEAAAAKSALAAQAPGAVGAPVASSSQIRFAFDGAAVQRAVAAAGAVCGGGAVAEACAAAGEGLTSARQGEPAAFVITARERDGAACRSGGESFEVALAPSGDARPGAAAAAPAAATLVDRGDGTYAVAYTLAASEAPRPLSLSVRLRGAHISGSPFAVRVAARASYRGAHVGAWAGKCVPTNGMVCCGCCCKVILMSQCTKRHCGGGHWSCCGDSSSSSKNCRFHD